MVDSFVDILAAGGSFVQNGYNGSITIGELNPLDGRRVWTGNSNGYLPTIVNLPPSAAGKTVKLRWRFGSGLTVSGVGWRIDTISVVDNVQLCATGASSTTSLTSSVNPSAFGQLVTFTATVTGSSGPGKPTGSVMFKDGGVPLGTAPLNSAGKRQGRRRCPPVHTPSLRSIWVTAVSVPAFRRYSLKLSMPPALHLCWVPSAGRRDQVTPECGLLH
jgi:hypothetical protein